MILTIIQIPSILCLIFNVIHANINKPDNCDASKTEQICTTKGFRFYYNAPLSQCVQFWGCPGHINNFASLAECQANCEDYTIDINEQSNEGICQQPLVIGPCRSSIKRYHYNNVSQRCEMFLYGGCQGNQNNFVSHLECQSSCENNARDVCQLPQDRGPCRSNLHRYYFNSALQRCETFSYGGCQGNKNNFNTITECQNSCGSKSPEIDVCSLPKAIGNCRSHSTKWYYNTFLQDCQQFTYSGCLGNQNNFITKQECESKCIYFGGMDINPCPFSTPLLDHRTGLEVNCGVCPYKYTCHTGNIADKPAVCCPIEDNNNNPVYPIKTNPCREGQPLLDPLTNQERTCGLFPHDLRCPITHECNSEIADRPAVCCPKTFNNRPPFAG